MEFTYEISKEVRNSGSAEELSRFKYIEGQLKSFGLETSLTFSDAFISLPLESQFFLEGKEYPCITASMAAPTGEAGFEEELVFAGDLKGLDELGSRVVGKIVVFHGFAGRVQVQKAEQAGAKACIFINGEHLHNMIVSPVWGNPTSKTVDLIPRIHVINVDQWTGEKIIEACKAGKKGRMITRVDEGWRKIPTLIAEIKGETEPENFILFSGHVDSWHYGAMDNASANAVMMEVGRILAKQPLRRTLRLAFWSGHSHGRYAGSQAYFDNHFQEIYDHCYMHINIDSVGAKGASVVTEGNIMALTKKLAKKIVKEETNQDFIGKPFGRNGDQSFWGAGVPSAFMSFSGQRMPEEPENRDTHYMIHQFDNGPESSGFGWWWHTKEDTIDKIDAKNLERDARVFLAFVYRACNDAIIPLDVQAGAEELSEIIQAYIEKAEKHLPVEDLKISLSIFTDTVKKVQGMIDDNIELSDKRVLNKAVHILARIIVRLMQVNTSMFDPDPAMKMPTVPLLSLIHQLEQNKVDEHEYLMLLTELKRRINQVSFILRKGAEEAEITLYKFNERG